MNEEEARAMREGRLFESAVIPYAKRPSDACSRTEDCALVKEHPGDCYLTAWLNEPTRSELRRLREW